MSKLPQSLHEPSLKKKRKKHLRTATNPIVYIYIYTISSETKKCVFRTLVEFTMFIPTFQSQLPITTSQTPKTLQKKTPRLGTSPKGTGGSTFNSSLRGLSQNKKKTDGNFQYFLFFQIFLERPKGRKFFF